MTPAETLQALKREMLAIVFWRFGAVSPVAHRPSLQESFSTWRPIDGRWRLLLWFNLSTGTTRMIDRALPLDLVDLVDKRGNLKCNAKEAA